MAEKYFSMSQIKGISRIETNQWNGPSEICDLYDLKKLPPADVRPADEILNAVDEAIIFLNNASHQMPYHVYSELYDLIYGICPNCGADMRGGDAE